MSTKTNISRFYLKISVVLAIVPLGFLMFGEIYTSVFNPVMDLGLGGRILSSFKITVYLLSLVLVAFFLIFSFRKLHPLVSFLRNGSQYDEARRASLSLPWFFLIVNNLFWITGTLIFYGMYGWSSPGGVPLRWALLLKSSQGFLSTLLMVEWLNLVLIPYRLKLEMTDIRPGERNHYSMVKSFLILISILFYTAIHTGYAAFFYLGIERVTGITFFQAMLGVLFLSLLFLLLLALLAARAENYERRALQDNLQQLIEKDRGNLSGRMILADTGRLGILAETYNRLLDKLQRNFEVLSEIAVHLADSVDRMNSSAHTLSESFRRNQNYTGQVIALLEKFSELLRDNSLHVNEQQQDILRNSSFTDEVTRGVDEICTTSKGMIDQAEANTSSASDTLVGVRNTLEKSLLVSDYVRKISDTVGSTEERSREIDGMIRRIKDISEETDVLSINAAIEAANTGAAGKGFSIVAGEIRKLSMNSARSAEAIDALMLDIKNSLENALKTTREGQSESEDGRQMAEEAYRALEGVLINVKENSEMIGRILHLAESQKNKVSALSEGMLRMRRSSEELQSTFQAQDEGSEEISIALEKMRSNIEAERKATEELTELADHLKTYGKRLDNIIHHFLS